jgi:hypothetical protein
VTSRSSRLLYEEHSRKPCSRHEYGLKQSAGQQYHARTETPHALPISIISCPARRKKRNICGRKRLETMAATKIETRRENTTSPTSIQPSNTEVPSGFILKLFQMVNGAPDEVISVRQLLKLPAVSVVRISFNLMASCGALCPCDSSCVTRVVGGWSKCRLAWERL